MHYNTFLLWTELCYSQDNSSSSSRWKVWMSRRAAAAAAVCRLQWQPIFLILINCRAARYRTRRLARAQGKHCLWTLNKCRRAALYGKVSRPVPFGARQCSNAAATAASDKHSTALPPTILHFYCCCGPHWRGSPTHRPSTTNLAAF